MSLLFRPRFSVNCTAILLALLTAAIPLRAADPPSEGNWPQWGGPRRDNVSTETGLLKDWPAEGPPLAWKITGVGQGYSGVSVASGRIFTMGDESDGVYVIALEEQGGKKLWATRIGQAGGGGGYPGPRYYPTVNGEFVYALGQQGDLACLEAATGKLIWQKNMIHDFGGQMMSGWGYAESPLIDGDKLVCTPGGSKGTMLALNKTNGESIWRTGGFTDPAAYSSIVPAEIAGQHQYVQLTGKHVAGISDSGMLLWTAERPGRTAVIPTPIVHDNEVFVTSGYNAGCDLFKITGTMNNLKAERVYHNANMKNHHGGVVLVDGYIYGSSDPGLLKCLEWGTGKEAWKDRGPGKGSLTYADGMLYFRNETGAGTVYLIEATPHAYQEHGHFDQPDRSNMNSWPHPVIAGGKLYLRDQEVLLCYNVRAK